MAEIIELNEACRRIRERVVANESEVRPLEATLGCVLAEPIRAANDSPPYDKSMVDGYAVVAADLREGTSRLRVIDEIPAGSLPGGSLSPGQAARIMTGAPLPDGADAVVMIERTRVDPQRRGWVEMIADPPPVGQNIMRRGTALRAGDLVVPQGQLVRPVEVGLLAEAGCAQARVVRPPRVATIQTGDELVEVDQPLGPGQIRNSNGPLLRAMIRHAGGSVDDLGIVADRPEVLRAAIDRGRSADVLVLSGGVSAGDRDLVPGMLAAAGVECVFHKVQLRPGKPLWFGVWPEGGRATQGGRTTLVFGLPGNPVSGLVCFRLFVTPTLQGLAGREPCWSWQSRQLALTESFTLRGARPTFWPGRTRTTTGHVEPLPWLGSADPFTLVRSDCLIFFAEGNRDYLAGEPVSVIGLDATYAGSV